MCFFNILFGGGGVGGGELFCKVYDFGCSTWLMNIIDLQLGFRVI